MIYMNTNMQDKDIPADFERKFCEKVGVVLAKPLERITLTITTGLRQMRAGSCDPMVSVDIHSINVFDADRNPKYTQQLLPFLQEELKLSEKRVLLVYHDVLPHQIGQVLT